MPSVANHKKVTGEENPAWRGGRVGKGAPEELSWGVLGGGGGVRDGRGEGGWVSCGIRDVIRFA